MDWLAELGAIGFTEYEAKTYLALLRDYPATGYQISKQAGVPRSMVYEALGRLHRRGAVLETHDGRASLYRPLAPNLLLDQHEQEHRRLIALLRQGLTGIYVRRSEDRIWSISRRRSVLSYATQMIRLAEAELYLVLDDEDLEILREEIGSAAERGIEISVLLTGEGELAYGQVAHHAPLESELQELTRTLMVVADGQEVLIARTDTETMATITRNTDLVLIARQFIWMELFAQRIQARLGADLLARLDPKDRAIFESFALERSSAFLEEDHGR
jgi:sugar-specific transcriptional regulator TrmB